MARTTIHITGVNTTSINVDVVFNATEYHTVFISAYPDIDTAQDHIIKRYEGTGSGTFSFTFSSLTQNTNYYIFAYNLRDYDVEDPIQSVGVATLSTSARRDYFGTPLASTPWAGINIPPTITRTKTINGVARIGKNATNTISGRARITKKTTKTINGIADIVKTKYNSIYGVARISGPSYAEITGVANIDNPNEKVTTQDIAGVARIGRTRQKTIDGLARIKNTYTANITGKANIVQKNISTIGGLARIGADNQAHIYGVAKIMVSTPEKLPENWDDSGVSEPQVWDKNDKLPEEWEESAIAEADEWGEVEKEAESWSSSDEQPVEWNYNMEETS